MSKKRYEKNRSEKHLANVLLASAIIELLTHLIDFISKLFD
jgi:hypothetical protein